MTASLMEASVLSLRLVEISSKRKEIPMPQIVPVSDFRSDIKSVSQFTDAGEVVILTQNGRPKWAMVDYEVWNAANRVQEMEMARALKETEERQMRGEVEWLTSEEFKERLANRRARLKRVECEGKQTEVGV